MIGKLEFLYVLFAGSLRINAAPQDILFPTETANEELKLGSSCKANSAGAQGTCTLFASCPELIFSDRDVRYCFSQHGGDLMVCCPNDEIRTIITETKPTPKEISAPILFYDPIDVFCGSRYLLARWDGMMNNFRDSYPIYHLNETADRLRQEGFTVTPTAMYGDAIWNMTYTNGSYSDSMGFDGTSAVLAVGGKPAPKEMAFFMALIGERAADGDTWFCDGVLINRDWVLSAAHCFSEPNINLNVIRLGDYDWSRDDEFWGDLVPFDSEIEDVFFYPDFDANNRYHDIVLVKLARKYPMFIRTINPICLPWDNHTNLDLVGRHVFMSGWGATKYDAINNQKTPILQAVELEIFKTEECDRSYATLPDYRHKWPQGMARTNVLCSGWREGGRDACKGDSGGPLHYTNNVTGRYTLAGIVSTGVGCGLKEFPGVYIPINSPTYLSWIKATAFQDYLDSADVDYLTNRLCYHNSPYKKMKKCPEN